MKEEEILYDPKPDLLAIRKHRLAMRGQYDGYIKQRDELTPEVKGKLESAQFFKMSETKDAWEFEKWSKQFDPASLELSEVETRRVTKLFEHAKALRAEERSFIFHVGKVGALSEAHGSKEKLYGQLWQSVNHIFETLEKAGVPAAAQERLYGSVVHIFEDDLREIKAYAIAPKELEKEKTGLLRLKHAVSHGVENEGLKGDALVKHVEHEIGQLHLTAAPRTGWELLFKGERKTNGPYIRSSTAVEETASVSKNAGHFFNHTLPWVVAGGVVAAVVGFIAMSDRKAPRKETWADRVRSDAAQQNPSR